MPSHHTHPLINSLMAVNVGMPRTVKEKYSSSLYLIKPFDIKVIGRPYTLNPPYLPTLSTRTITTPYLPHSYQLILSTHHINISYHYTLTVTLSP